MVSIKDKMDKKERKKKIQILQKQNLQVITLQKWLSNKFKINESIRVNGRLAYVIFIFLSWLPKS